MYVTKKNIDVSKVIVLKSEKDKSEDEGLKEDTYDLKLKETNSSTPDLPEKEVYMRMQDDMNKLFLDNRDLIMEQKSMEEEIKYLRLREKKIMYFMHLV